MTSSSPSDLENRVLGCLLAGEIGDAMGAPAENKTYQEIAARFGEITEFTGIGTDDSALKYVLCDTILRTSGYPTADAWAEEWLRQEELFLHGKLFWVPVMNSFWRVRGESVPPREAGLGTMASSSSAMCISPMGILHAGNPRQAALETFELVSLIHHNYCRDAACSMAAATAQAFLPGAPLESVLEAATDVLPPRSARIMREAIQDTLALARQAASYPKFRERYYAGRILPGAAMPDSRETVPVALALFYLAGGDPRYTILFGANFGRDADTIASMAGALAGAFRGAAAIPPGWLTKIKTNNPRDHLQITAGLVAALRRRSADLARVLAAREALEKQ